MEDEDDFDEAAVMAALHDDNEDDGGFHAYDAAVEDSGPESDADAEVNVRKRKSALWVDRFRPQRLSRLDYHPQLTHALKQLVMVKHRRDMTETRQRRMTFRTCLYVDLVGQGRRRASRPCWPRSMGRVPHT